MKKPEWENDKFNQQEFLLKEIEVIYNQISKFDEYSLIVKGWAITLWTALFFYAITQNNNNSEIGVLWLSIGILLGFWLIDTYFKVFQRVFIARSNFISDYLNGQTPPKENNKEVKFPIYDPIGRISKERKEKKKEKKIIIGKTILKESDF